MKKLWISLVFITLLFCSSVAHTQDRYTPEPEYTVVITTVYRGVHKNVLQELKDHYLNEEGTHKVSIYIEEDVPPIHPRRHFPYSPRQPFTILRNNND